MSDHLYELDPDLDALDLDLDDDSAPSVPIKKVPAGDLYEAARAGDCDRLKTLIESGANVNLRDRWDSVALYYACLVGHFDAARLLLEAGAVCSERTFDGDRCHYAALNLRIRRLLKRFEARPPPLEPLNGALRDVFLSYPANQRAYLDQSDGDNATIQDNVSSSSPFPPDITFYIEGQPIEAHRVILSARSPFFNKKFRTEWKNRKEVRFSSQKLSYHALYSLLHFFYSDRVEISVDNLEELLQICKSCKLESLKQVLEREIIHQKYADFKAARDLDNSQKRFVLQGSALPEKDRLADSLRKVLEASLEYNNNNGKEVGCEYDFADICVKVGNRVFRCHQVILAARSEYFRARLSRVLGFMEGNNEGAEMEDSIPYIEEQELSSETFEKMIEYMYTDGLRQLYPDQAEEMFDAASRYLLFPLKRAVADVLLPQLETASPSELCHWLILSDMYGVIKIREYCLDVIACNFETFADCAEFRAMLLTLPAPSGDSSSRTTRPSAPGAAEDLREENLLDDLREKWLEAEGAELDKRDESAVLFDERLESLMLVAQREAHEDNIDDICESLVKV